MFDLIAILIPIVLAVCIVVVVGIVEGARVRRRLIDTGADEALARAIIGADNEARRRGALKWGIVLVMIGGGFAAIGAFRLDAEDPLSYALLFAATGLGMLLFRRFEPPTH